MFNLTILTIVNSCINILFFNEACDCGHSCCVCYPYKSEWKGRFLNLFLVSLQTHFSLRENTWTWNSISRATPLVASFQIVSAIPYINDICIKHKHHHGGLKCCSVKHKWYIILVYVFAIHFGGVEAVGPIRKRCLFKKRLFKCE